MPAVEELPAWSEPFNPETRKGLTRLPALETIDREWAFGGATGEGVSVAIIDSGVEADHPSVRGRLKALTVALWYAVAHNLMRAVSLRAARLARA